MLKYFYIINVIEKCSFRENMDIILWYHIKYNIIYFRGKKGEWKGKFDVNKKGNFIYYLLFFF